MAGGTGVAARTSVAEGADAAVGADVAEGGTDDAAPIGTTGVPVGVSGFGPVTVGTGLGDALPEPDSTATRATSATSTVTLARMPTSSMGGMAFFGAAGGAIESESAAERPGDETGPTTAGPAPMGVGITWVALGIWATLSGERVADARAATTTVAGCSGLPWAAAVKSRAN